MPPLSDPAVTEAEADAPLITTLLRLVLLLWWLMFAKVVVRVLFWVLDAFLLLIVLFCCIVDVFQIEESVSFKSL